MGVERGHRTLSVLSKRGKTVTVALAPRTARAIGLAIGERCEGPNFLAADSSASTATARAGSCGGWRGVPGSPNKSGRTL